MVPLLEGVIGELAGWGVEFQELNPPNSLLQTAERIKAGTVTWHSHDEVIK
jgi:hypothetical protein